MLVKNWMSKNVETIGPDDSMLDAVNRMRDRKVHMMPVLDGKKIVGIITDRDIKRSSASDASTLEIHELMYLISKIKVRDIMSKKVVTVPDDYTVEETAEVLLENRISGVPVVDKAGKIAGVITQTDIFRVLISITGVEKRGIQFAFLLEDQPGSIKAVADAMRAYGGRIASILTSYEEAAQGHRKVFIRMYGLDRFKLDELKKELKEKFHVLYMVDNREEKREIYE